MGPVRLLSLSLSFVLNSPCVIFLRLLRCNFVKVPNCEIDLNKLRNTDAGRRSGGFVPDEISVEQVLNVEKNSDGLNENQREPHGDVPGGVTVSLDATHGQADGYLHDHRQKTPRTKNTQWHADQVLNREANECRVNASEWLTS